MSMVQRVETACTAAATVFMTAARIAATTSPCPTAPSGLCRPKKTSINRRPLASGERPCCPPGRVSPPPPGPAG